MYVHQVFIQTTRDQEQKKLKKYRPSRKMPDEREFHWNVAKMKNGKKTVTIWEGRRRIAEALIRGQFFAGDKCPSPWLEIDGRTLDFGKLADDEEDPDIRRMKKLDKQGEAARQKTQKILAQTNNLLRKHERVALIFEFGHKRRAAVLFQKAKNKKKFYCETFHENLDYNFDSLDNLDHNFDVLYDKWMTDATKYYYQDSSVYDTFLEKLGRILRVKRTVVKSGIDPEYHPTPFEQAEMPCSLVQTLVIVFLNIDDYKDFSFSHFVRVRTVFGLPAVFEALAFDFPGILSKAKRLLKEQHEKQLEGVEVGLDS
jgi:hypothetical protein